MVLALLRCALAIRPRAYGDARMKNLAALLLLSLCALPSAVAQTENAGSEPSLPQQYSGTAFGQAGATSGKSFGCDVFITRWTTDQELQGYVATLRTSGQNGLVKALEKTKDVGRLSPTGFVGAGFRIARYRPTPGGGLHIVMVTNRPIALGELYHGTRSTNYKFGIVVLDVDKDGKGTGTLAPLCMIKFNKNNELEIEHYGQKPFRLVNVRRVK
jgi:hypothetical protein